MILDDIRKELFRLQDIKYRDFQARLIPTVPPETVIGVRTPELRRLAKQLRGREDIGLFLDALPHTWFDENQLHAFILSDFKDCFLCMDAVDRFLPFVDNWATCDQMSPKVFSKHRMELLVRIREWICSDRPFTVRFGVKMLMDHFLDDAFDPSYAEMVASIHSGEYYVMTIAAWYFATALAKQYDHVIGYLENRRLDTVIHNMAIRKACESFRIDAETKEYLKTLKQ